MTKKKSLIDLFESLVKECDEEALLDVLFASSFAVNVSSSEKAQNVFLSLHTTASTEWCRKGKDPQVLRALSTKAAVLSDIVEGLEEASVTCDQCGKCSEIGEGTKFNSLH